MRQIAKNQNMKMNEYGLFKDDKRVDCKNEREIFSKLGLAFIPPETREDLGEIELAKSGKTRDLYDGTPFYGLFHIHSTYSDGANTLNDIAKECLAMGLSYVGICDHSKSAFYANGLSEERVQQQQKEIDELNGSFKDFKIFKGIEADILVDGSLDYDDTVLASFDFVVASVHSNFNLSRDAMTERICNALKNPHVTMLGHPSGRLLLAREAYELDMEKVIKTAGEEGKIIEINANPFRLDLDWRWGALALHNKVKTAINPDAHSLAGLKDFKYGIGIARKAGFKKEHVLNSFPLEEVELYFNK
jgi:DNA polymerase (family 10)